MAMNMIAKRIVTTVESVERRGASRFEFSMQRDIGFRTRWYRGAMIGGGSKLRSQNCSLGAEVCTLSDAIEAGERGSC